MPFSKKIKREVREKAAFRCCRCPVIGIDIHHIISEKDCGSDDIDNAAPSCQNCHAQFGDNLQKRKETTHMRDWWYGRRQTLYSNPGPATLGTLSFINTQLEQIKAGQENNVINLKHTLSGLTKMNIESISAGSVVVSASAIVNTAAEYQIQPKSFYQKMCPNSLLSTVVQSAATFVAIAAGFIISRLLALSAERSGLGLRDNNATIFNISLLFLTFFNAS